MPELIESAWDEPAFDIPAISIKNFFLSKVLCGDYSIENFEDLEKISSFLEIWHNEVIKMAQNLLIDRS